MVAGHLGVNGQAVRGSALKMEVRESNVTDNVICHHQCLVVNHVPAVSWKKLLDALIYVLVQIFLFYI